MYGLLGQTRTRGMWTLACVFNLLRGLGLGDSLNFSRPLLSCVSWSVLSKTYKLRNSVSISCHLKILHFVNLEANKTAFKQEYSYIYFDKKHLKYDIDRLSSYETYWVFLIYTLNQKSLTSCILCSLNKEGV